MFKHLRGVVIGMVMALCVTIGFSGSAAEAQSAKYPGYTWVFHKNTGNDQAFAIQCAGAASGVVYWVQKGQSSTNKCPSVNGAVWGMYVPSNFNLTCDFGSFVWYPPSGTWVTAPNGSGQCWTNHK